MRIGTRKHRHRRQLLPFLLISALLPFLFLLSTRISSTLAAQTQAALRAQAERSTRQLMLQSAAALRYTQANAAPFYLRILNGLTIMQPLAALQADTEDIVQTVGYTTVSKTEENAEIPKTEEYAEYSTPAKQTDHEPSAAIGAATPSVMPTCTPTNTVAFPEASAALPYADLPIFSDSVLPAELYLPKDYAFPDLSAAAQEIAEDEPITEPDAAPVMSSAQAARLLSGVSAGAPLRALLSDTPALSAASVLQTFYPVERYADYATFLNTFYILDPSTSGSAALFSAAELLGKPVTLTQKQGDAPQILIYHTHASETYIDSRAGVAADTVVGPGALLAEYLREYGFSVLHDTTVYDTDRNYAYSVARPAIEAILAQNPSIEVVIDLHRDSGAKRVTEIDGKPTAQLMLFNGLCRNTDGAIASLPNPYLTDNLAFSLQTNLLGRTLYQNLMFKIYLKNYRYNMHLCAYSMLVELGTEQNTVEEARNAMRPFAEILFLLLRPKE